MYHFRILLSFPMQLPPITQTLILHPFISPIFVPMNVNDAHDIQMKKTKMNETRESVSPSISHGREACPLIIIIIFVQWRGGEV